MEESISKNSLVLLNTSSNNKITIDFEKGGDKVINEIMTLFLKKQRENELELNNKYNLEIIKNGKLYMNICSYDTNKLEKMFEIFKTAV